MQLEEAYKLIRRFEGCKLRSYQDSVGIWTIGYGTTAGVHQGMEIDLLEAERLMERDVSVTASLFKTWIHTTVSDNELSAMISLAYNIGNRAFHMSHLLADLNAGKPKLIVAQNFMSWVHAGGHILQGLVNRRHEEMKIFLS